MLKKIIAHASVILSVMYVIFFHIDRVNPLMAFIDHPITKALMYALSVLSVVMASIIIAGERKKAFKKYNRYRKNAESKKKKRTDAR